MNLFSVSEAKKSVEDERFKFEWTKKKNIELIHFEYNKLQHNLLQ